MQASQQFVAICAEAFQKEGLHKLTLSKPRIKGAELANVYGRPILLKDQLHLQCTLRYATRDETRNLSLPELAPQLAQWLQEDFFFADAFTNGWQYTLQQNKKGNSHLRKTPHAAQQPATLAHNHEKVRPLAQGHATPYLQALGIAGKDGAILQKGQHKYGQINHYIEVIGHLLDENTLPPNAHIVDMGAGKGYLTFALYDYLRNVRGWPVRLTGVELRDGLVTEGNALAERCGFEGLRFEAGWIEDFSTREGIDMLIALHACDTATDDAIAAGIRAGASVIVVAPCCHKQVRNAMQIPDALKPLLRHGILLERQAELLTDGLRALFLEAAGYRTKVFEFINLGHTPKNVIITAVKDRPNAKALEQIGALKQQYGLPQHYLETLLDF